MGLCDGRTAIVTGAGRGIGREHALALARAGASVVVNDIGTEVDGTGTSAGPAHEVVEEIIAAGGRAIANGDDVSDEHGAERLIDSAISTFGSLDVLVNNAGILRDRMIVTMSVEEWDAVIRVHLRGSFLTSHFAAAHWRERHKSGSPVDARIVNTTSNSGLFGNVGQVNYGAAKAGIAAMTVISAMELGRYGVTVNAVSPGADTRMTVGVAGLDAETDGTFDPRSPANIAPLVVWLASPDSRDVTGRVFLVRGPSITVAEGWQRGPEVTGTGLWDPAELGARLPGLVATARANAPTRA